MKRYMFFMSIFVSIIFTGCSQRSDVLKSFSNQNQNPMAIQYTKKRDFFYDNSLKAMIFATYLNKISKKYETNKLDSFIVGLHIVNQSNHDLIKNRFEIFLNEQKPKTIVKVDNNSDLVELIPLKNKWGEYYLIHFDNKQDINKLNLKLIHPVYGQVLINFDK